MAWFLCLFRPDRVKGLVNMSVTFDHFDPNTSISNNKWIEALRAYYGDDYYMCRFQVTHTHTHTYIYIKKVIKPYYSIILYYIIKPHVLIIFSNFIKFRSLYLNI